jgi:hypothetical protein
VKEGRLSWVFQRTRRVQNKGIVACRGVRLETESDKTNDGLWG